MGGREEGEKNNGREGETGTRIQCYLDLKSQYV